MAAVGFQLAVPLQAAQGPTQLAARPPEVNPNQAQGAPSDVPAVGLPSKPAEGQQTQQGASGSANQLGVFFLAERSAGGIAAPPNQKQGEQNPPPTIPSPFPVSLNQAQNPTPAAQNQPSPEHTAAPGASESTEQTPEEQLQELDQTLQQIGINPEAISLFSRMGMLLYAKNPAALRVLVQSLQQADTPGNPGQPSSAFSAGQTPAATQAIRQAANQGAPQVTREAATDAAGVGQEGASTSDTGANTQFARFQLTSSAIDQQSTPAPSESTDQVGPGRDRLSVSV